MVERDKYSHYNADGSGKKPYPSRKEAKRIARRLEKATGSKYLRVYGCGECAYFHIGGTPPHIRERDD